MIQRRIAARPLPLGLGFGLVVWAASYPQLVPLGVYSPPWHYSPATLAEDASYHASTESVSPPRIDCLHPEREWSERPLVRQVVRPLYRRGPGRAGGNAEPAQVQARRQERYRAYGRALQEYLPKIRAEVLYAGNCSTTLVAPEDWGWDALVIVRHPSRETFMNPEYQKVTHLRTEALTEVVLQATVPW